MKILFCDWNGTILDDMQIWNQAMRATFIAFRKQPPTIAEYFRELESGDYLEVYRRRDISASREELNAIYEPAYEKLSSCVKMFAFAKEALQALKERNVLLVLVTAQQESLVAPLLDKFDIRNLFEHCAFHAFDKKTVITEIIRRHGANPKECYFVGDAPSDIRHAKKAGIKSMAFLTDYIPEELLVATNPDYCIHNLEDVAIVI